MICLYVMSGTVGPDIFVSNGTLIGVSDVHAPAPRVRGVFNRQRLE